MFLSDKLNLSSERKYTDEGFLRVPARISRIGVQDYMASELGLTDRDPGEKVSVYRPANEVFDGDSLQSFANKPVTNNHPPDLVNSKNFKDFSVGFSGDTVQQDGMFAKTVLNITDADAIQNIESGKVELSNGYTADIDWTPGVTDGGLSYDGVQRNIKGNHIALVTRGRAGADCKIADNLTTDEEDDTKMAKVTIDGVDFDVSDQAAQAIDKLMSKLKDAQTKIAASENDASQTKADSDTKTTEMQKTQDELQAKLDSALSKIPTAKCLDELVDQRIMLVDAARRVAPTFDWKGKDAATICKSIVADKCPNVKIDDVSSDYIKARFDTLVEATGVTTHSQLDSALTSQLTAVKTDDADTKPAYVIAREKMINDSKNAWKKIGEK